VQLQNFQPINRRLSMNSQTTVRLAWSVMIGVITPLIAPNLAEGANLRTPMINEGYLSFRHSGPTFNGEERTGWTDIRHPAYFKGTGEPQILTTDPNGIGYDRSDFHVDVRNIIVKDANGVEADPKIERDYNFANQIYAQLGISVLNAGNTSATYPTVTYPLDSLPSPSDPPTTPLNEIDEILSANRSAPVTINNYYVRDLVGALAFTVSPEDTIAPNKRPKDGILIGDVDINNDTFAHELGHFLLDKYRFAGGNVHSPNNNDLMAINGFRNLPNNAPKGLGNDAPKQPGQPVGNIGGRDRFEASVNKAGLTTKQIHGIFDKASDGNFYVQRQDNGFTHGDRADFDWVEDNIPLELAGAGPGGDNLADNHDGVDFMIWEIGNIAASSHPNPDHNHGDWSELKLGRFNGNTFQIVDVISQIARYADMDVDASGQWSPKESALDYIIEFSSDSINWVRGTLNSVFEDGWTLASKAEDYVARWFTDIAAKFVRIAAQPLGGNHDGNTQIDALIAGTAKDFGDAPNSYKTLLASDGPRYDEGVLQRLGAQWDSEIDGQPTILADGDDKSILGGFPVAVDDEDGVIFGDSWVDVIFNITRPDPNPYQLRAWWDTNYNGVFDHTSELYIDDLLTLAPGIFTKRYNLGFNPKADGLYSRFRLTWDPLDLDVKPFGEYYSKADCNTTDAAAGNCVSHGEVEDYVHVPEPIPEPSSIFGLLAFGGLGLMGLRKKR
jgi:hypothetical protein